MKYACNSFVSVEKPVELIEGIAEKYFGDFIHATRKHKVRMNGFAIILFSVFRMISDNCFNGKKIFSADMNDLEGRYDAFGKAGILFEFSTDNNRNALMYGDSKVGVRTLKAVVRYLEEKGFMTHEKGFCIRKNADGFNPYKLGLEYINFRKFAEIFNKFWDELNDLFDEVEVEVKVKKSCGVTFVKIAVAVKSVANAIAGIPVMKVNSCYMPVWSWENKWSLGKAS